MSQILREAIEFNLTEHCNLKCSGCDHASPLLPKKLADRAEFERDMQALAQVLHVRELKLLGGEPLLHPELLEFVRSARHIGIADQVTLVSNGVLLNYASEELLDSIDRLWISLYPGVGQNHTPVELHQLSLRHGFELHVRRVNEFRHTLINTENEDEKLVAEIYADCGMAHRWSCHTVYEGRYYKCSPAPFLEARLSAKGEQVVLPMSDSVALHDNPDLRAELERYIDSADPLFACRYCLGSSGRNMPHRQLNARERKLMARVEHPDPSALMRGLVRRRFERVAARLRSKKAEHV